jgi:hypothetical protein
MDGHSQQRSSVIIVVRRLLMPAAATAAAADGGGQACLPCMGGVQQLDGRLGCCRAALNNSRVQHGV